MFGNDFFYYVIIVLIRIDDCDCEEKIIWEYLEEVGENF